MSISVDVNFAMTSIGQKTQPGSRPCSWSKLPASAADSAELASWPLAPQGLETGSSEERSPVQVPVLQRMLSDSGNARTRDQSDFQEPVSKRGLAPVMPVTLQETHQVSGACPPFETGSGQDRRLPNNSPESRVFRAKPV
jgi:hypothetical protein